MVYMGTCILHVRRSDSREKRWIQRSVEVLVSYILSSEESVSTGKGNGHTSPISACTTSGRNLWSPFPTEIVCVWAGTGAIDVEDSFVLVNPHVDVVTIDEYKGACAKHIDLDWKNKRIIFVKNGCTICHGAMLICNWGEIVDAGYIQMLRYGKGHRNELVKRPPQPILLKCQRFLVTTK